MARPSKNRTERMNLRLTPEELARLKQDADIAAVELSTFARARIMDGPVPRRARRKSVDHEKLATVLVALGKLGTNLNQLAKVANATGDLTHFRNVKLLKNRLEEIRDDVRSALTP